MDIKNKLAQAIQYVETMTPQEFEDFIIRNDPSFVQPTMTSISFREVSLSEVTSNEHPASYCIYDDIELPWAA